ncbi:hypothetical protein BH20ACT18_BH20ACT18_03480 [soil metagenome]
MAHPAYLRDKARSLRVEKRLTIDELAERLALPRTTIFSWVRDLPIPPKRQTPAQGLGTQAMQAKYQRLREAAYKEGVESFAVLSVDPMFRDFVALYVAEGYKRDRNVVSLANSDPAVIVAAVAWYRRLSTHRMSCAVQYHKDQDVEDLRVFWGRLLGISGATIRVQRKSNSSQLRKRTWRCRYGVLTVTVSDTLLRARLQGWMDSAREEWFRLAE